MELKPGQIVNVFEDPVDCNKLEGKAKLLKCYRQDWPDKLSLWDVRFLDDGYETLRTINFNTA